MFLGLLDCERTVDKLEGIKDRSEVTRMFRDGMEGIERGKWSVAYPFKLKFVPFRCDLG